MHQFSISTFSCHVFSSIHDIDSNVWNGFVDELHFYHSYPFLSIVERTQKQIECRYCVVYENDIIVALVFFQLSNFKLDKLMQYNSSSSNFIVKKIKHSFSNKELRLLNLGNIFFTGDKGVIANNRFDIYAIVPALFDGVAPTYSNRVHAYLTSNINLSDEKKCHNFPVHGFCHFDTEPDMLFHLDDNWTTFDEYMCALSSKYRVRNKKILALSDTIKKQKFSLDDVVLYKKEIDSLFCNVMQKSSFNISVLNTDFFVENYIHFASIFEMYGYFLENKLVGFSSIYSCQSILHVHYIGLDYEVNHTHKLYNRMLLDVVHLAIENKIKKIHFGRTATEIKSTIGAKPIVLNAYLKINNRFFNRLLPYALKKIKTPDFVIRNPFK